MKIGHLHHLSQGAKAVQSSPAGHAGETKENVATHGGQQFPAGPKGPAPDTIQDDVKAGRTEPFPDLSIEPFLSVVNGHVGTQVFDHLALGVRAGRSNHVQVEISAQLNGRGPDTSRGGMDEHPLARMAVGEVGEGMVRRQVGDHQGCGIGPGHCSGKDGCQVLPKAGEFGMASKSGEPEDSIPDLETLYSFSCSHNVSGALETRNEGNGWRFRIDTQAAHDVGEIETDGPDGNQNFSWTGDRIGPGLNLHIADGTVSPDDCSFHGARV